MRVEEFAAGMRRPGVEVRIQHTPTVEVTIRVYERSAGEKLGDALELTAEDPLAITDLETSSLRGTIDDAYWTHDDAPDCELIEAHVKELIERLAMTATEDEFGEVVREWGEEAAENIAA